MKHWRQYEEIVEEFIQLTSENREYILAITRALSFAQKSGMVTAPEENEE